MMRRALPRWLALGLALIAASTAAAQQRWYVHAQAGNDANTGLSADQPFRTLARWEVAFNAGQTTEGDTVLLSGTFREYLNINMADPPRPQGLTFRRWDVLDENPLNLVLTQPVLRGDVLLTGWTRAGSTNRYVAAARFGLSLQSVVWNWDSMVDEYGRNLGHLRRAATIAEVEATPYTWFYDGLNIHVNVTPAGQLAVDPALGVVGYVPRGPNGGLTVQGGVGVVYDGLEAYLWLNEQTGTYGFSMEHARDGVIRNCRTRDTSHHGIGFTGFTESGNVIEDCEVRGLMGLVNDNSGDCFGMLSNNRDLVECRVSRCTAHCYSLMTPLGAALNPQRKIHGFRSGTTESGRLIRSLDVEDLTVYSYYPECHRYSTPVRLEDAMAPTNPLDPATYGVRFTRLRVVRGGYLNIAGLKFHAAFVDCDLSFSECSRRGLQGAGAIGSAVGLGVERRVLFKDSRIDGNVDNPMGRWYTGELITVRSGTNLYMTGCQVQETGLRARGSTASMVGWIDPGGTILARETAFGYAYARGARRLCSWDEDVLTAQRDFGGCVYGSIAPGYSYTHWYGPDLGLPDIRDEAGWLGNVEGDPFGLAKGQRPASGGGSSVFHAGDEADDQPR